MIGALKQLEAGRKAEDVAREVWQTTRRSCIQTAKGCGGQAEYQRTD